VGRGALATQVPAKEPTSQKARRLIDEPASLSSIERLLDEVGRRLRKPKEIDLLEAFDPSCVIFIETPTDRDEVLAKLALLVRQQGWVESAEEFLELVRDRERSVSTGIGLGVAIPHAKLPPLAKFFVAVAILRGEGVAWNAIDDQPVRLVFLIGGPEQRTMDHLKLLSQVTSAVRKEPVRSAMLQADGPQKILEILKEL